MYLGLLDAGQVKAAAQQGVTREKSKRDCEATFFLGELAVHTGQTQRARNALRDVTSSCGPAETVYSAALAEMRLLPQQ
jgi:TolA-binding protein